MITINPSEAIGTIRESLRCSLRAAGLVLPEPALTELLELCARNATQALVVYGVPAEERPPAPGELLRPCTWCGYTHRFTNDANDASKCPRCFRELSPVATRVLL